MLVDESRRIPNRKPWTGAYLEYANQDAGYPQVREPGAAAGHLGARDEADAQQAQRHRHEGEAAGPLAQQQRREHRHPHGRKEGEHDGIVQGQQGDRPEVAAVAAEAQEATQPQQLPPAQRSL